VELNYEYYGGGNANEGKIEYATLKVKGTNVRRCVYTYYGSSDTYGSLGDLRRVQTQQWNGSSWETLGYTLYRYYKSGDTDGFAHGLKYVVDRQGYQELVDGGLTPETASNTYIADVATHFFKYDGSKRVKEEQVYGGGYEYDFAFSASGFSDGMNSWKWKTTETLPNGAQNIIYTNYAGQPMLKVFKNGNDEWYEFWEYDTDGRVVLNAKSSAISGYNDTKADLLNKTGGNYQYLNNSSGLIYVFDYYTTTGSGGVAGKLQYRKLKEGENGTEIKTKEYTYTTRTAGGKTIYVPWKVVCYPSASDQLIQTECTVYTYTWYTGTVAMKQRTTTWPAVGTSQHGSGSTTSRVEEFNEYGMRTWLKDERG
jgi:hypothetical protein